MVRPMDRGLFSSETDRDFMEKYKFLKMCAFFFEILGKGTLKNSGK